MYTFTCPHCDQTFYSAAKFEDLVSKECPYCGRRIEAEQKQD